MPPDAAPLRVTVLPRLIDVVLTVDLFVRTVDLTFTVKYFLSIAPFASLTLIQTSYFVAAAGLIVAVAVVLKPFTVVHFEDDAFL